MMLPIECQFPAVFGPNGAFPNATLRTLVGTIFQNIMASAGDKIHLYKAPFVPNKLNLLADFVAVEPTVGEWPSYAPAVSVSNFPVIVLDQDGNWEANQPDAAYNFSVTGAALGAPVTIAGMFVTDTAVAVLEAFYRFPAPVVVQALSTGLGVFISAKTFE
jgi:hypothetical protein